MGDRARRATLCVGAALLVLGGCSGDDDGADDDSSVITDPVETSETIDTTSTSSSTTTTADPEAGVKADVEEAYLAYWDAFLVIFGEPHPNHPEIERYTTEAVREATLFGVSDLILRGESIHPPENPEHFNPTVLRVEVDGNRAEVEACIVDGAQIIENSTGTVVNDAVVTKSVEVEMAYEAGLWKVAQSHVADRRDGVWDCRA